jgi:threonine/homoserine/homoserine lactone efflux protein
MTPTLFYSAVGLGLAYNAAPGAVNTETIRRGLQRGFGPALRVQLGALIGDTSWAVVAVSGAAVLVRWQTARALLGIAGSGFLLWLAAGALVLAIRGDTRAQPAAAARGDFATGAFFSLANPFALAFWLGVGGGITVHGGSAAGFLAGFVLGAFTWCCASAAVIGWGRRLVGDRLFRLVDLLCGLALAYYGISLLWGSLRLVRA